MSRRSHSTQHDFRAAIRICRELGNAKPPSISLDPIQRLIDKLARQQELMETAFQKGWRSSCKHTINNAVRFAEDLHQKSCELRKSAQNLSAADASASPVDIYREITALHGEFPSVEVHLREKRIVVQTESIELSEMRLGVFQIKLRWDRVRETTPYSITAMDSLFEAADGSTHPHVQNEKLCEGEGATIIRRALSEGRLFDFFTVVDRILKTYNPDSAYTSLEDWDTGITCHDCGDRTASDDVCSCARCEVDLCEQCTISCNDCSDRFCSDCIESCDDCDCEVCSSCRELCTACDSHFCSSCLTDGMCHDCTEEKNHTPDSEPQSIEPSHAAIHSVCDGETAVPA